MHLVVPAGGVFHETRRIELSERALTIGRRASCDVPVDVAGVDAEHALVSAVAIVALGNDCAVGDVPLEPGRRRLLSPGDELQLGSAVFMIEGDPPAEIVPRIRVVEGASCGGELVLAEEGRMYMIGRSRAADLVLSDREVSREHLRLVRHGANVFLLDADSSRGSHLGRAALYRGAPVPWTGTRMLKVGATVLSLLGSATVSAPEPALDSAVDCSPEPRSTRARWLFPIALAVGALLAALAVVLTQLE